MVNHFLIFINDLHCIFMQRRGLKKPLRLLFTHIKIKFKQKSCEIFKIRCRREKVIGLEITFPDYGWFSHLWREIFIQENYYFESENDQPRIVDVGSNIGVSVCYFKILYPNSEILCFEPDPQAFQWLAENVKRNNLRGVYLYNAAAGTRDGKVKFYQDSKLEASGINTTNSEMVGGQMSGIEVESKKISSFLNKEISLLKIDAEGAEYDIFQDINSSLSKVRRIFLEVHQSSGSGNNKVSFILDILENNGFHYAITKSFLSHHEFIADPLRSSVVMIDATRVPAK